MLGLAGSTLRMAPCRPGCSRTDLRGRGAAGRGRARAHGLPSRLDALLADLDHGLVLEAEAFAGTAAEHGFALKVEPWPVCLGYTSYLRCAAYDGVLEGLTALYAADVRLPGHLDGRGRGAAGRLDLPRLDPELERAGIPRLRLTLGRGLDELAGAPSPALTGRLGVLFTDAARFELAFWEMCWSGQAWPA